MRQSTTRRSFLHKSAALGAGFWVAGGIEARASNSPNEEIGFACIGVGGRGSYDSNEASRAGRIVAICDVDQRILSAAKRRYGDCAEFTDFREMLDKMGDQIDAVTVTTPDHSHAPAALMAMRMGKHCFCQKPLARTVYETRMMAHVAQQSGVVTQMGNQATASHGFRQGVTAVARGMLGEVREVHVWKSNSLAIMSTEKGPWKPGPEFDPSLSAPSHLDWDCWLSARPVKSNEYSCARWPSWGWRWNFGTGTIGHYGCDLMNLPYLGLRLCNPTSIRANTSGHGKHYFPAKSIVTYQFPKTSFRPAIKMIWYDGGHLPPKELFGNHSVSKEGLLIIGSKNSLLSRDTYGMNWSYLRGAINRDELDCPKSPGHFKEWIAGMRGGPKPMSNFTIAAGLTETALLGNLAVWAASEPGDGPTLQWDAQKMAVKNANVEGLQELIKPIYRQGYTLDA